MPRQTDSIKRFHLRQVEATMSIEGMDLTERDRVNALDCLQGTRTAQQIVDDVVSRYRNPEGIRHVG